MSLTPAELGRRLWPCTAVHRPAVPIPSTRPPLGIECYADAGAQHQCVRPHSERVASQLDHILRHTVTVLALTQSGQHHGELVAAQTSDGVGGAHGPAQTRGKLAQNIITG